MNQFSPVHTLTGNPLSAFLDQHGEGLGCLLAHIYGPLGTAVFSKLSRLGAALPPAHSRSLLDALDEAITMLLDFVGEPICAPEHMRPQEFEGALRWYAARLQDLRPRD
jgi:hypothetical protein